jgi:L-ribulose-5-phosphate 3-epimerase
MAKPVSRRDFLVGSAASAATMGLASAAASEEMTKMPEGPKKAVLYDMLPSSMSREDRFKLARDVGFAGVEASPITDLAECDKMRAAAEKAGIRIHSVIYGGWDPPLTHPDAEAREKSIKNAEAALRGAKQMGADGILLVPGVVNAKTRYVDAYKHAREGVKRLIPVAEELQADINLEEVWNNFLLSPMEFAAFVDSFKNKWVQAYFDVGNVVTFGWPEDWIRTLGKRIHKVHLKDYKGGPGLFGGNKGSFVNLREGSINWPEVRKAFAEIGYTGFMTTELGGGGEAYLRDVSSRVDKILAGE